MVTFLIILYNKPYTAFLRLFMKRLLSTYDTYGNIMLYITSVNIFVYFLKKVTIPVNILIFNVLQRFFMVTGQNGEVTIIFSDILT